MNEMLEHRSRGARCGPAITVSDRAQKDQDIIGGVVDDHPLSTHQSFVPLSDSVHDEGGVVMEEVVELWVPQR